MLTRYEQLANAVAAMYHDIQRIERLEMARFGLKGPQAQCLLAMSRFPEGVTAAELCGLCEKDKAAVSRILAELEQAGLVIRKDRNGSRYRAPLLLTERGQQMAAAVNERADRAVERASLDLSPKTREEFYGMLSAIAENLRRISREDQHPTEEGEPSEEA